jgi:hypothetical protein
VVAAVVILFLLVIVLGTGLVMTFRDSSRTHGRIEDLRRQQNGLSGRVNAMAGEIRTSHAQLVDGLWQRASVEVDQEIEKARARGRDY